MSYFERFISILEGNRDIESSFTGIRRQMTYGLVFGIIGGLVAGPLGGTLGAALGAYCGGDDYPGLINYLKNLDDNQRERLVDAIQRLVGNASEEALSAFLLISNNQILLLSFCWILNGQIWNTYYETSYFSDFKLFSLYLSKEKEKNGLTGLLFVYYSCLVHEFFTHTKMYP